MNTTHVPVGYILHYRLQHPLEIQHKGHAQTRRRHSPTAWSPLSVFRLRKSFGTAGELLARDVNGASVFALWRPRLSSTCLTISTIRLKSCRASLPGGGAAAAAGAAEGAHSLQWPVSVHISSTSPILKCLRSPLIAPVEWEREREKKKWTPSPTPLEGGGGGGKKFNRTPAREIENERQCLSFSYRLWNDPR